MEEGEGRGGERPPAQQPEGEQGSQGRGFTIVDRRQEGREPEAPAAEETRKAPPADFSTFALSLGSSALYHLGLVPDPHTGEPTEERDLVLVRQTIDTLEMLEQKTRGNLDEDEAKLLGSLLYELRMRFVEATREAGKASEEGP